jgi:hypothetical protein
LELVLTTESVSFKNTLGQDHKHSLRPDRLEKTKASGWLSAGSRMGLAIWTLYPLKRPVNWEALNDALPGTNLWEYRHVIATRPFDWQLV